MILEIREHIRSRSLWSTTDEGFFEIIQEKNDINIFDLVKIEQNGYLYISSYTDSSENYTTYYVDTNYYDLDKELNESIILYIREKNLNELI